MSVSTLIVWWGDRRAGRLTQDRSGDIAFVYDAAWLADGRPLSLSLPLRADPFSRAECRPFFAGLLPEEGPRDAVAGLLGVSPGNDFALLDQLGGDVAGALSLLPEGAAAPHFPDDAPPAAVPLGEAAFGRLLDGLPRRPLLADVPELRMSLAGAQPKVPVVLIDGSPALPAPGQPTTHIVKPENPRFPGIVANEAWCMQLARRAGLRVARVEARVADGRRYLLVERYDRRQIGGRWHRLHQEDACQALGIAPERKYAKERGPAFNSLFRLTRGYARQPAGDVLKLIDIAVFNLAIGNADAHGKNFAFLLDDLGPRLAPFYDLVATMAWPELTPRMAMRVGRAGTIEELGPENWARFSADAGTTVGFLRRRVAAAAARIAAVVAEGDDAAGLAATVALRADLIRQSLG